MLVIDRSSRSRAATLVFGFCVISIFGNGISFAAQTPTANDPTSEIVQPSGTEQLPDEDIALKPIEDYTLQAIEGVIEKLDSRKFAEREAATEELARLGEKSIKPIAIHFFRSSAEANWRIKRVLELISTDGDEKVFLKSAGILQLLYGQQNEDIQNQIAMLQKKWRATRRVEAIANLKKLGFEVSSGQTQYNRRPVASNLVYLDGSLRQANGNEKATKNERGPDPRNNRRATILEIEKILANSTDDNRRLILSGPAVTNSNSDPMEIVLAQRAQQAVSVGVVLPKDWKAEKESVDLLYDVEPISQLTFQDQKLTGNHAAFVGTLNNLTSLTFRNCSFDLEVLQEFKLPPSARFVTIAEMELTSRLIKKLSGVQMIGIENCELNDRAIDSLKNLSNVRTMAISKMKFSKDTFSQLLRRPELGYVTFSQCEFKLDWLREIQRERRELTVEGTPKAFLGVQGPVDVSRNGLTGCQISRVVGESGAEKGGMLVGDIITALDDEDVSRFTEVRLMIAQKKPGDKLKVQVRRGSKTLDLDITLGDIEAAPQ